MPCQQCLPLVKQLQAENQKLKAQLLDLQLKCEALEGKGAEEEQDDFRWEDVATDYCDPTHIQLANQAQYLTELLSRFPIIRTILSLFLSKSHKRKARARSTHPKWRAWSNFYKSWLADVFLRSRSPKSVRRSTLLVSCYLLLGNVSQPSWRLLQRLKLVVSKEVVERWVKRCKKVLVSKRSLLMHVIDNCDVKNHKTFVRSDNRTEMINLLNRFVVEVHSELTVTADELWSDVDRNDFGMWIQSNNDEVFNFANNNWEDFCNRPKNKPLRFLYDGTNSNVQFSDITFLQPIFNKQTLKTEHVKHAVDEFHGDHMAGTTRVCAIISGDFQVWIKLWWLHVNYPEKYNWLIPVPGEWHWTWHILQGIYKMYYKVYLLPFSKVLGFRTLDAEAKNFHYAEDLLEMVTIAISNWIEQCVEFRRAEGITVAEWLHDIGQYNKPAYELAYACIHYFVPYWHTRAALKWNKIEDMEVWWRYWIHLFIACGKTNYSLMSIRYLWMLRSLHPQVVHNQNRVLLSFEY